MRGQQIIRLRSQRNLSMQDLAKLSQVDSRQLNRIEKGFSAPSACEIERIADALGVSARLVW